MRKLLKSKRETDRLIAPTVFALALLGLVMIYSASSYSAEKDTGDSFFFVKKQLAGFFAGGAAFLFFSALDYRRLKKLALPALLASYALLALVFVPGIGIENYGAKRWIGFGSFTMQPSEIAKFAFVLFAAAYMSTRNRSVTTLKGILPVLLAGTVMCVLIILEPNMSITVCVALSMMIMLYIGGARLGHLSLFFVALAAMIPVLIILEPYRMDRLLGFLDPWASPKDEGYQLIQSLYALGSGGFFGVGLFNSRQKYEFLPFSESDFIFSVIGEELGALGCLAVIGLFFLLIYRGIRIAAAAKDRFGCYLASGITAMIAVQAFVNIAVVTGSIPPTGLPLPFISYGGSSLTVFLGAAGMLKSVSSDENSRLFPLKDNAEKPKK